MLASKTQHKKLVKQTKRIISCINLDGKPIFLKVAGEGIPGTWDDRVGGCGVHVSSQLGHLKGAGGGPWTPKGMGGIPMWPGRAWGWKGWGRKSGSGTGPVALRGGWGGVGFPHWEGPTHCGGIGRDGEGPSGDWGTRGECGQILPHQLDPQWACCGPGTEPPPLGPLQLRGSWAWAPTTPPQAFSCCVGPPAWAPPPPGPPLAAWVQAGWAPLPSKAYSCFAGPCGQACRGLCPSWPAWARVLWASFRNRHWWKEHTQRWGWHSGSRYLPRGIGGLLGRRG